MAYNIVDKLKSTKVLVVGDFMVDVYLRGKVTRISPEAPVPIINVTETEYRLGGTGNVVNNVMSLGGKTVILTCVGRDKEGDILLNSLKDLDCDIQYIKKYEEISTTSKTRVVADNKQMLRIDKEQKEPVPNDYIEFVKKNLWRIFEDIDIVVISDYDKGIISAEFAHMIIQYANSKNIPIIVDPKGKNFDKYRGATVCTPNIEELSLATGEYVATEEEIEASAKILMNKGIHSILVTKSDKGMSLVTKEKKADFPVMAKEVADVTGAGDTVVATLSVALGSGFPFDESCAMANQAASIVVQKFGTAVVSLQELRDLNETDKYSSKLVNINDIVRISALGKKIGKKIVFTNGCFVAHWSH